MSFLKRSLAAFLLVLASLGTVDAANTCTGIAQGGCNPGLTTGQVPTAAQWNSYFAVKQDYLGYTPLNPSAVTGTSPIVVTNSSSGVAISCPTCGGGGASLTVGTTTIIGGTTGRLLYDNVGVLGELATTGTGDAVLATSPTLTTSATIYDTTSFATGVGGILNLNFKNASAVQKIGAKINTYATTGTNGAEIADLVLSTIRAGTLTEAGRILGSGRWIIGATLSQSVDSSGAVTPWIQLYQSGDSGQNASIGVIRETTPGAGGGIMALGASRGTPSTGSYSALLNGDGVGQFIFVGDTGSDLHAQGASIQAVATGTWTTSSAPTKLLLRTTPVGAIGPITRMTIDSAGAITAGLTGTASGSLGFYGATSGLVTIQPAAAAGTWTLTLPTDDGTSGQFLSTDGNGITSWASALTSLTVGTTSIASGTTTRILYDNAGTLGEYTITGTGTVVAMQTSPSLVTPALGVATATSLAIGGATIGANAIAVTGTSLFNSAITLAGVIRPSVSSDQNDWNPTGLSTASTIITLASGPPNITGLAGGVAGRIILLLNGAAGTTSLTLKTDSASSSSANQFALGSDLTLPPQSGVYLVYDGSQQRWLALGTYLAGVSSSITQLTGDVTAGPGAGSVAATLAPVQPGAHTWNRIQTIAANANETSLDIFHTGRFSSSGYALGVQSGSLSGTPTITLILANVSSVGGTPAAASRLLDLQNAGVSKFSVDFSGNTNIVGTLDVAGAVSMTNATINMTALASVATTSAVCYNTGTGLLTYNGTVGTCTVSLLSAKNLDAPLMPDEGMRVVMEMQPWRYHMKPNLPTYSPGEQVGFVADFVKDRRLVAYNLDGSLGGFRYEQYTAFLTAAMQQMKADNDNLALRLTALEQRLAR